MTGDPALVEDQKSNFVAFLTSISFTAGPATAQLPPGHPEIGGMDTVATGSDFARRATQLAGTGRMDGGFRRTISGGEIHDQRRRRRDGGGECQFLGRRRRGVGGELEPLARTTWAGADGRHHGDGAAGGGGQGQLVDLSGTVASTGQPAELVGVMVTQPDKTWFYKLMGDPKVVAAQKQAFTQFVQGVKY